MADLHSASPRQVHNPKSVCLKPPKSARVKETPPPPSFRGEGGVGGCTGLTDLETGPWAQISRVQ